MLTVGIVLIVVEVVFSWSLLMQKNGREAQARSVAAGVATEQLELIRNATYNDIGTTTGLPTGTFLATQTVTRGDVQFTVRIDIDYVDDPYDGDALGTIPDKPVDTVPADYKRVEVTVCWTASCPKPVQLTSTVAPKDIETATNTGALFIAITDANGLAVPLVDVVVTNPNVVPPVNITNRTDVDGLLQLLSLPPATGTYHIEVSKSGYTSDTTLAPTAENPNPVNPDTTVVVSSVTQISFSIDRVSTVVVQTEREGDCEELGNIQFRLDGSKLIGTNPDVRKYSQTFTTDGDGRLSIPNLEWDHYELTPLTAGYDIAGSDPPLPLVLNPNTTQSFSLRLGSHTDTSLLVAVLDAGTKLPLADASVRLDGSGYDQTKVTNQGYLQQTDWSGGAGQETLVDPTKFQSQTGSLGVSVPGQVQLASQDVNQSATEDFSTTDNRDAAATTAEWVTGSPGTVRLPDDPANPGNYLGAATAQSVKLNGQTGKILDVLLTATQTLNGQTIEYAVAADGVQFEPVTTGLLHTFATTGSDLRWRATLSTNDPAVTPLLNGVSLTYAQRVLSGTDGTLTSSTFDAGTGSTFTTFSWNPSTQPPETGDDSLKFQIATNNDQATWLYRGPDGTASTFYTVSGTTLHDSNNGNRYLRYRAHLQTADPLVTPSLSDLSIIHSNSCFPPGQVFFPNLPANGDYTLTVTKTGYLDSSQPVTVTGTTRQTVLLSPSS